MYFFVLYMESCTIGIIFTVCDDCQGSIGVILVYDVVITIFHGYSISATIEPPNMSTTHQVKLQPLPNILISLLLA